MACLDGRTFATPEIKLPNRASQGSALREKVNDRAENLGRTLKIGKMKRVRHTVLTIAT
jgi:hypothetical protein